MGGGRLLGEACGLSACARNPRRWAIGAYFADVEGLSTVGEMHVRRRALPRRRADRRWPGERVSRAGPRQRRRRPGPTPARCFARGSRADPRARPAIRACRRHHPGDGPRTAGDRYARAGLRRAAPPRGCRGLRRSHDRRRHPPRAGECGGRGRRHAATVLSGRMAAAVGAPAVRQGARVARRLEARLQPGHARARELAWQRRRWRRVARASGRAPSAQPSGMRATRSPGRPVSGPATWIALLTAAAVLPDHGGRGRALARQRGGASPAGRDRALRRRLSDDAVGVSGRVSGHGVEGAWRGPARRPVLLSGPGHLRRGQGAQALGDCLAAASGGRSVCSSCPAARWSPAAPTGGCGIRTTWRSSARSSAWRSPSGRR